MRSYATMWLLGIGAVLAGCAKANDVVVGDDGAGGDDTTVGVGGADSTTSAGTGSGSETCATAPCDENATCSDASGVATCICKLGFEGDGVTCADIDECAKGTAMCATSATCQNIPGSYSCACDAGYTGDGKTCSDINECQEAPASCDPNATCKNAPGSYACACDVGYTGDGKTCSDIDECAQGTAGCALNATCKNSLGAFACTCNPGYQGDGFTCTAPASGEVSIEAGSYVTPSTSVTLYLQEPSNLIKNPGGELGTLVDWQLMQSGGDGWSATVGDPAIGLFGQQVFLTSYDLGRRSQLVDLLTQGFSQSDLDAAPPITVREWYRGGGYNTTDKYYFLVELRDANNAVLASYNLGTMASPVTTNASWQIATQTFAGYGAGLRYVYFEDGGNDAEFWAGYYGAAMDGASLVVGDGLEVRFSNDTINWSAWQPFASTLPWTLEPGSGIRTVYVEFKDGNNKTWPVSSDTITLQ